MDERDQSLVEQGKRVQTIIEAEGLTQAEFSEKTGIKTSTLNHVIKGRNNISPMVMHQMLSAYPKYSEEWIRTGEGQMISDNPISGRLFNNPPLSSVRLRELENSTNTSTRRARTLFDRQSSQNASLLNPKSESNDNKAQTVPEPRIVIKQRKITKIIVYYNDNTFETFTQAE